MGGFAPPTPPHSPCGRGAEHVQPLTGQRITVSKIKGQAVVFFTFFDKQKI